MRNINKSQYLVKPSLTLIICFKVTVHTVYQFFFKYKFAVNMLQLLYAHIEVNLIFRLNSKSV